MIMVFGKPLAALWPQLVIGLGNGAFYALLSLGFAVIFGLLDIVNFTHGALFMLGALVAWMMLSPSAWLPASWGVPDWLGLGYWPALTLLGIAVVALLLTRTTAAWLPAAFVASHALSQSAIIAIKPLFHRTRPDDWLLRHEIDMSYPSGHSSTAVTFFLGLIVLVWHARIPIPIEIGASMAFGICVFGIPWSRLALGAHYLTDVLGGLLFGTAWLAASIAVYLPYAR